ncbi:hypothetical protein [Streptomyces fractus]|uniref:hypothetical protein n=1 Tax=Streptomyces fractus TaxID=641806 RepID=UPI003CE72DBF
MKIVFLAHTSYGMGGVVTAVANLTAGLVERHEVEVISVYRSRDQLSIPLPDGVAFRSLIDLRATSPHCGHDDPRHQEESRIVPKNARRRFSLLAEVRLIDFLSETDADVVVATCPELGVLLANQPGPYLRMYQVHAGGARSPGK